MDPSAQPPCIILNEPQLAENIGAVARVMANFGLSDLRLVRPRDGWPQDRAWASASGADWPLDNARVFDRLEDAAADLQRLYATTARPRETAPARADPARGGGRAVAAVNQGLTCGLLFGGERAGLETADIALCQAIVTVPVDARFRSLNLAQAVALNAYEWRLTVQDRPPAAVPPGRPARRPDRAGRPLRASGARTGRIRLLPSAGKDAPRWSAICGSTFARSSLSSQETRTLRGVITALTKGRGRVLARLARERAAAAAAELEKGE